MQEISQFSEDFSLELVLDTWLEGSDNALEDTGLRHQHFLIVISLEERRQQALLLLCSGTIDGSVDEGRRDERMTILVEHLLQLIRVVTSVMFFLSARFWIVTDLEEERVRRCVNLNLNIKPLIKLVLRLDNIILAVCSPDEISLTELARSIQCILLVFDLLEESSLDLLAHF